MCALCGADVFRALLVGEQLAAREIISATPDRYGIGPIAAYRDVAGTWHARLLLDADTPRSHERRHRLHLEQCPDPRARRNPGPWPPWGQATAQSRRSLSDRAAAVSV